MVAEVDGYQLGKTNRASDVSALCPGSSDHVAPQLFTAPTRRPGPARRDEGAVLVARDDDAMAILRDRIYT